MTSAYRFDINSRNIDTLLRQDPSWIVAIGNQVRDEARSNAKALGLGGRRESNPETAIISVPGDDSESIYVDVGYSKHHPGFYLWWWEIGTRDHAARPHLRPALRPGLLSDSGGAGDDLVSYTTRAGVTRMATARQVANWTRGSR